MADMMNDHLDEGTIHAWLDGALPPDESARVERHAASCASCGAAVAEARGLVAASSRILSSLDDVASGVIPGTASGRDQLAALRARREAARRQPWWRRPQMVAAASLVLVAGTWAMAVRFGVNEGEVEGLGPVAGMARPAADSQAETPLAKREVATDVARDRRAVAAPPVPGAGPAPLPSTREADLAARAGAAAPPAPANELRQEAAEASVSRAPAGMARQQGLAQDQAASQVQPSQQGAGRSDSSQMRAREAERGALGLAAAPRADAPIRAPFQAAKALSGANAAGDCYSLREVDPPGVRVLGVPDAIRLIATGDSMVRAVPSGARIEGLTMGARFIDASNDLVELVVRRPLDSAVVRFSRSAIVPAPVLSPTDREAGVKWVVAIRIVCPRSE